MGYNVQPVNSNGWIFIYHEDSTYEPDSFFTLVKSVQTELGGEILKGPEDGQYVIDNDQLKLIFQWDDLFGNVVIVQDLIHADSAIALLERHCRKLDGHST